jgi:hypothetical protein
MESSKLQNARDVVAFCKKNKVKNMHHTLRPSKRFIDTFI